MSLVLEVRLLSGYWQLKPGQWRVTGIVVFLDVSSTSTQFTPIFTISALEQGMHMPVENAVIFI